MRWRPTQAGIRVMLAVLLAGLAAVIAGLALVAADRLVFGTALTTGGMLTLFWLETWR